MFRRRNRGSSVDGPPQAEAGQAGAEEGRPRQPSADASGPWDIDDVPEGALDDQVPRLDLGSLRIPTVPDVEIRLDTEPAGAVVAVVLRSGPSTLEIGAFAAPRRAGIWNDVRAELLESLHADGSSGEERQGAFGPELLAAVPGPQGTQTARFVGVDGPRWFLRGVFTGPAATDQVQANVLECVLRGVVVARGGDALPVRDSLPLVLPPDILEQAEGAGDDSPAPRAPRRGPEITEIG